MKKVLDLIKDETQFLLDMKVRDQLAELPPEQRDVLQIDALLRYIGDLEATGSVEVNSPKWIAGYIHLVFVFTYRYM